jgi:hypothetical protein
MKRYIKCSNDNLTYENYGDANFLDGGLLLAEDPGYPGCFYFYKCDFVNDTKSDRHYLLTNGYIDINDSWIDVDSVESFSDAMKESDPWWFAEACLQYYGAENFGGNVPMRGDDLDDWLLTSEEVEEHMKNVKVNGNFYISES